MAQAESHAAKPSAPRDLVRTLASRFVILLLCVALVLSALAYGTVHYWSLALFVLGACSILILWAVDAWRSRTLRFSLSPLQLPLVGLMLLGLVQLLPLRSYADAGTLSAPPISSLSIDPYSTRLALVQIAGLLIYFAAALAFIDSPRRLRVVARTVIMFGFVLAILGLIQSFTSPNKIFWLKDLPQSQPFGPFYNRHHFAAYMEMALALPLGLLFSGAIERDKKPLYIFAAVMMAIALVTTNSRGAMISLVAEVGFLVATAGVVRSRERGRSRSGSGGGRARSALVRAGVTLALVLGILGGSLLLGGEAALSRLVGTVNSDDPTTGRSQFWGNTLRIIRDHPVAGTGLGSFGLAYTQYDTRNGLYRLEQAHNDYLQLVSDAGLVGAGLGVFFVFVLFRKGFARRETEDPFRRGVATGALAGCFAVLVHSFFDFTLHTTANALLFLTLAALATINGRVEQAARRRRRHGGRHRSVKQPAVAVPQGGQAALPQADAAAPTVQGEDRPVEIER